MPVDVPQGPPDVPAAAAPPRKRVRVGPFSISVTLATSIGLLVFAAAAAVLVIGFNTGRQNTLDLLNDRSIEMVATIETGVRNHLEPARDQVEWLVSLVESKRVDPRTDAQRFVDMMVGGLAATPQTTALVYVDADLQEMSVARNGDTREADRSRDDMMIALQERARADGEPFWGPLTYVPPPSDISYVNYLHPIYVDGAYVGVLASVISISEMSLLVTDVGGLYDATAFILYGEDRVLAHPNLTGGHADLSPDNPAVALDRVGDLVLAGAPGREPMEQFEPAALAGVEVSDVGLPDGTHIMFRKRIDGFGHTPLVIGAHAPINVVDEQMRRLIDSGVAGLIVLAVALVAAIVLGKMIARPIRRAAEIAGRIGDMDLEGVRPMPPSMIRELNEQGVAFNRMLVGLRWFEAYVPRRLVRRLIRRGQDVQSMERDLTIMFTDIVGFTTMAEDMPAGDIADELNAHFQLLADAVEAEGGTIDKFIGDALMAFWGAPDDMDDHGARGLRAVRAMAVAVNADNARRRAAGKPAVRVRIGLHTGPVVVGNIGVPSRMNYTIVGDAVNTAQRIEALGKQYDDGADVTVLVSAATARAAGEAAADLEALGDVELKGRSHAIGVLRCRTADPAA